MAIHLSRIVVGFIAQLYICHFIESENLTAREGTNDKFTELFRSGISASVFHCVLISVIMIFPKGSRSSFNVLPFQHSGDVRRDKTVLRHLIGFHPDTHTVIGTEQHHITHTPDTLDARFHVYLHVIVQELQIIFPGRVKERECFQFGILLLHGGNTDFCHFGRKQTQGSGYTVLYVYRRHISITSLLEINIYHGITVIRGRGGDISHIFHPVDGLLQRNYNRFLYRFGVGSRIVGKYLNSRRCNIRILFHRQIR